MDHHRFHPLRKVFNAATSYDSKCCVVGYTAISRITLKCGLSQINYTKYQALTFISLLQAIKDTAE